MRKSNFLLTLAFVLWVQAAYSQETSPLPALPGLKPLPPDAAGIFEDGKRSDEKLIKEWGPPDGGTAYILGDKANFVLHSASKGDFAVIWEHYAEKLNIHRQYDADLKKFSNSEGHPNRTFSSFGFETSKIENVLQSTLYIHWTPSGKSTTVFLVNTGEATFISVVGISPL